VSLQAILDAGQIGTVFQPIVDLHTGTVVGYEALSRGPAGSPLERPDRLFAAARREGLLVDLDCACRAAAVSGARDAGLTAPLSLFVNVEPLALGGPCPDRYEETWDRAGALGSVVYEITERALTARPAELCRSVASVRRRGGRIALDDIGADTRSLALMPLIDPDVLKLDLRLVHEQPTPEIAAIVNAVSAHRERTGALILAEGIETEEHAAAALGMGATLGQGWLFGRPGPLPPELPHPQVGLPHRPPAESLPGETPFEVLRDRLSVHRATKPLLIAISLHLEQEAATLGPGALVLATFQTAERFTPAMGRRYAALGRRAALVAALAVGLQSEPVAAVRGAELDPRDPLRGEWSVLVIGQHFAGALVAQDVGDTGPESDRRFDYGVSYDRDLIVRAAGTLMERIEPLPEDGAGGDR